MISYRKALQIFNEKNITSYTIKKDKVIGQASYQKILTGDSREGNIDMRTLANLCKYLGCQPGDLIEWVPDQEEKES